MAARGVVVGIAHVTAFVVLSLAWMLVLGTGTALVLLGTSADPLNMGSQEDFVEALGAGGMGISTFLQHLGMVAIAAALTTLLPRAPDADVVPADSAEVLARWRGGLALRRTWWGWSLVAGLGALAIGWLPSWISERLLERAPEEYVSTLVVIAELLLTAAPAGRAALLVTIVIGAPIFEELIFRGYLWAAMEKGAPPAICFVGTSLLFAAYHQDPVHIIGLLPTAFFLGWLRWTSGSVWPGVVGHFVNNGLSAILLFATADMEAFVTPLWLALSGFAASVAVCAAGYALRPRRPPEG